jgi:hypothetical protein
MTAPAKRRNPGPPPRAPLQDPSRRRTTTRDRSGDVLRFVANRERVLGRGRSLWLANSLLDAHSEDIDAAIDELHYVLRLRWGCA